LVELIRSGKLNEGDGLPGERRLAELMDVSRPTIRLAIGELADAGVVEVRPGRSGGIRVVSMWIPDTIMEAREPPGADETFQLLEARRAVEPKVAQLAALRGADSDFIAMQRSIEVQRENSKNRGKAVQAEMMFHRLLWHAACNPPLEIMMCDLMDKLEPVRDMILRTQVDRKDAVDIHQATLTAIMRGASNDIDSAMDVHMSHLEQIAEDAFGRRRIREIPHFLGVTGASP